MKTMKLGVVLLALLLAAMAMVPMVNAAENTAEQQAQENLAKEWQDAHKIKVTQTTVSTYKDGIYETVTTYTGDQLKNKIGAENFTIIKKIPLKLEDAKKLSINDRNPKISTKESFEIFTTPDDPPRLLLSYPQWIYEKDALGNYHQLNEPTNMIWRYSTLTAVRNEIWVDHSWYYVTFPYEDTYYIYDGGWKADYGLANDPFRLLGGYHIRLWELSSGDVIGAAHQDSSFPHSAVGFETAEVLIADFFRNPDDGTWSVYNDYYNLGNPVSSPYNNGYATMTYD